jgi:hypothetical protein
VLKVCFSGGGLVPRNFAALTGMEFLGGKAVVATSLDENLPNLKKLANRLFFFALFSDSLLAGEANAVELEILKSTVLTIVFGGIPSASIEVSHVINKRALHY